MISNNLMNLIGKEVEVISRGMAYKGKLIEVSDTDVFLQGQLGWIQVPVETVTAIKPVEKNK